MFFGAGHTLETERIHKPRKKTKMRWAIKDSFHSRSSNLSKEKEER